MTSSEQRARRKINRVVDRYAGRVGPKTMEELLQERAQDMREAQDAKVSPEDIELGDK